MKRTHPAPSVEHLDRQSVDQAVAPRKLKLPPIADIEVIMTWWFVEDPTWAKQISDDLWEQLGKSRAGMFDQ
jgi:hypothetical protein